MAIKQPDWERVFQQQQQGGELGREGEREGVEGEMALLRLETAEGKLVRMASWDSPSGDGPKAVVWSGRVFVMQRQRKPGMVLRYREIVWEAEAERQYRPRLLPP